MDIFARWAASCSSLDVLSVAQEAVDGALGRAAALIDADPLGLFLYPLPAEASDDPLAAADEPDGPPGPPREPRPETIAWPRIGDFDLGDAHDAIRAFIGRWQLGPGTRVVLQSGGEEAAGELGRHHYVHAHFSRPTPSCPNPLAVAAVHFAVHVSRVLPPRHPVMVTYRFEGHRAIHYAVGRRCQRSTAFQRFFVETILRSKLAFYAEVCDCVHPRPAEEEEEEAAAAEEEAEEEQDTSGQRTKRDTLRQSRAPIAVGSAVRI